MSGEADHPELAAATQAIWEQNAPWWDEQVGEGDLFQTRLVWPATERLLEPRPGQHVLDLACGNGASPAGWPRWAAASWPATSAPPSSNAPGRRVLSMPPRSSTAWWI